MDAKNASSSHGGVCADDQRPPLAWTWGVWAVFAVILLFQPNYSWHDGVRSAPYGSDFLQEWIGGHIILSGQSGRLYDNDFATALQRNPHVVGYERTGDGYYPMVYPPYWYIACTPFAAIPLKWAAPLWLAFLTAVWFFTLRWAARCDHRLGRAMARAPQLALIAGPLLFTYGMGQKAGLIAAIVLVTLKLLEQKKYRRAGIICGLLAFKPHFVILLGIPLVVRFGMPFLTGILTTGVICIAASNVVDPGLIGEYIAVAISSMSGDYTAQAGYHLEDAHNWAGFWNALLGAGPHAATVTKVSAVVTFALMIAVMSRRPSRQLTGSEWAVLTTGLILASPHLYGYDLALLIVNAWLLLRQLDTRAKDAVAVGALAWYLLTVLPGWSANAFVPIQWSTVAILACFVKALINEVGPIPISQRINAGNIHRFFGRWNHSPNS